MSPCPKCGKHSLCGCKSCKDRRKGTMPMLRTTYYVEGGEIPKCPYCRVGSHPDEWLRAEWDEYQKMKEK
jgi:hypothetical protein